MWHSNAYKDITWPNSTLYSSLNGSVFLTSTTYVPSGWSDKIFTNSWKYGDIAPKYITGEEVYEIENAWTSTVSAKIGLMYLQDYYYGLDETLVCRVETTCHNSWIHLWNESNDSEESVWGEWTMSRGGIGTISGTETEAYFAKEISKDGDVGKWTLTSNYLVRPVFYLTNSVSLIGGTGTIDDLFIIN